MVRIDLEGFVDFFLGVSPIVVAEGAGQEEVVIGVFKGRLGGLGERGRGERRVLLVESEFGDGEIRLDQFGALLDGDVVAEVENLAGVYASCQIEATQQHLAFRGGVSRRSRPDPGLDGVENGISIGLSTVKVVNVTGQQKQSDAAGESAKSIFQRAEGGGVEPLRHLRADLEKMPAFDPGTVADFFGR